MSVIQKEIFNTIKEIAKEKKISEDYIIDSLKSAIVSEYTKEYVDAIVDVEINPEKSEIDVNRTYTVVADDQDENFDDYIEIPLEEAKTYDKNIKVGDTLKKHIPIDNLNKILIQNI
jgi:N utilization substance protein A